jgi:hypothetical protein
MGKAREGGVDASGGGAEGGRIDRGGTGRTHQTATTTAVEEREGRGAGSDAGGTEERTATGLELEIEGGRERMGHGVSSSRGSRPN